MNALGTALIALIAGPAGWAGWILGLLSTALLFAQHQSSRLVNLRKAQYRTEQVTKRADAADVENLSLRNRNEFLKTAINKLGEEALERKDTLDKLTHLNDGLRRQVASMRVDLDHEKRRADEYYQRLVQVLAEQNKLDDLLNNRDNITG